MMAKGFSSVDIRYVHLNRGDINASNGVSDGIAVVSECSWVNNDSIVLLKSLMNDVYQFTFVIRLKKMKFNVAVLLARACKRSSTSSNVSAP